MTPALENVALWHERDISHSSVERMIAPGRDDHARFRAGAADRASSTSWSSTPKTCSKNLDRLGGLIHSQRVLLALTQKGVSREDAYALRAAQRDAGLARRGRFLDAAQGGQGRFDGAVSAAELEALFDLGYHLKHVDTIFARVFGK